MGYLSVRSQADWIDHALSDFLICSVGVSQGSILGPFLLLIYFNDLQLHLESSIDSYADDTTVTATGASIQAIEGMLERDCENVSTWMKCNRLKLNPEKIKILALGTKQKLNSLKELEVLMDNKPLKQDESKCEAL